MNELATEKTMTVKDVANALGVSTDTVKNCIRRIFPTKMENGKTTFLNEKEVACISKELKSNNAVLSHQTYEVSSQVMNTTTELEILANYKKANGEYRAYAEYQHLFTLKTVVVSNTIHEQLLLNIKGITYFMNKFTNKEATK